MYKLYTVRMTESNHPRRRYFYSRSYYAYMQIYANIVIYNIYIYIYTIFINSSFLSKHKTRRAHPTTLVEDQHSQASKASVRTKPLRTTRLCYRHWNRRTSPRAPGKAGCQWRRSRRDSDAGTCLRRLDGGLWRRWWSHRRRRWSWCSDGFVCWMSSISSELTWAWLVSHLWPSRKERETDLENGNEFFVRF